MSPKRHGLRFSGSQVKQPLLGEAQVFQVGQLLQALGDIIGQTKRYGAHGKFFCMLVEVRVFRKWFGNSSRRPMPRPLPRFPG